MCIFCRILPEGAVVWIGGHPAVYLGNRQYATFTSRECNWLDTEPVKTKPNGYYPAVRVVPKRVYCPEVIISLMNGGYNRRGSFVRPAALKEIKGIAKGPTVKKPVSKKVEISPPPPSKKS